MEPDQYVRLDDHHCQRKAGHETLPHDPEPGTWQPTIHVLIILHCEA